MPTLLHISASPRGDHSISHKVTSAFVEAWRKKHPDGTVVERDLTTSKLTFVDLDWIQGAFSPPEQHSEDHKRALAISDTLVDELLAADTIAIGSPMYNFAIPAVLKAWIDHVVRGGRTFIPGSGGAGGLAGGRRVVVAIAAGAAYTAGTPLAAYDQVSPYLRQIFGFIGITDIAFLDAGGAGAVMQGDVSEADFLAPILVAAKAAA